MTFTKINIGDHLTDLGTTNKAQPPTAPTRKPGFGASLTEK